MLLQYDRTFIPLKVIKDQTLIDLLVSHHISINCPLNDNLPDDSILSLEDMVIHH